MQSQPQKEHEWLHRIVGEWTGEFECDMGPDQPPSKSKTTEVVRSVGGLWVVGEGVGDCPMTGQTVQSIITLGYDPKRGKFVGTFVASMMDHLWLYEGALDDSGRKLVLDAQGPTFEAGKTGLANYQDVVELLDNDRRTLTSYLQGDDGQWRMIMKGEYRRKK